MAATNLKNLGLGRIIILEALLRLRSVTRAAEETHQSRPSVSLALRCLREILSDELLVQKGRELSLTSVGASLLAPTQALLLQAEAIYSPIQFDCRTSTRTFTLVADEQSLRSEEHTSELQSLMRISYAVFCLKKKNKTTTTHTTTQ